MILYDFLDIIIFFLLLNLIIHHSLIVYLHQTWINCSIRCHQRAIFVFHIAYVTNFVVLNDIFRAFLLPQIYSVYSFTTLKKEFSDLSKLKR